MSDRRDVPYLYADAGDPEEPTDPGINPAIVPLLPPHTMIGLPVTRLPAFPMATPTATRIPYVVRYPPVIDPPVELELIPLVPDARDGFDDDVDAIIVDVLHESSKP